MLLLKPQRRQMIILIKLFTNHMILEGVLLMAFLRRNVISEAIASPSQVSTNPDHSHGKHQPCP